MSRKKKGFSERKILHIYTEGETEERYFKFLKSTEDFRKAKRLKVLPYCEGKQGLPLMAHVKRKVAQVKKEVEPDEIYVIFDKDELSNEEIQHCLSKYPDYQVGFSNPSFELWLLLHFQKVSTRKTQKQLEEALSQVLDKPYSKANDEQLSVIIQQLSQAHENAKDFGALKLENFKENPYTNLSQVIQQMLGE